MDFRHVPTEIIYGLIAVTGGIARYLNGYVDGRKFKFGIFLASAVVAGFSGYMFALLGTSLFLPDPMPYIFAGCGGFFGEQTMKFIMEMITKEKRHDV